LRWQAVAINTGAKAVGHDRYAAFQMAGAPTSRNSVQRYPAVGLGTAAAT